MLFVDRARELASLESAYTSDRAELHVLYGRRRVGKTELLRQFCDGKHHIFFIADLGTESSLLADFTRQVSLAVFGRADAIGPFPSWDVAFEFVADQAESRRLVVVLDEFTYLGQVNPALPSILQRIWDSRLQRTRVMLVLCGSYVGMMEKQVLGYRAPLYGRRTGQWQLQPLGFGDAVGFFPDYSPEDRVRAYAVLGGIPAYLQQFDPRHPLLRNLEDRLLTPGSYLHEEPRLLLLQELGEPGRYFAILEAIANKRTRPSEIAQAVGLPAPSLPFYLGTLRELGLVERMVRVTEPHPERSKRGSYRIADDFFRFWFRYVYPNRSLLGRGEIASTVRQVQASLDEYVAPAFEGICREHVWRLSRDGLLGFMPHAVGGWWTEGGPELDVVALGEGAALVGECKWSLHPVDERELDLLIGKGEVFRGSEDARRLGLRRLRYALFSRSGFTSGLLSRAAAEGVLTVDLTELARLSDELGRSGTDEYAG